MKTLTPEEMKWIADTAKEMVEDKKKPIPVVVSTVNHYSDGTTEELGANAWYLHELLDRASIQGELFDTHFTYLLERLGFENSDNLKEFELFKKYEQIGELLGEFYQDIAQLRFK